ncbi:MAG: hypothetical protein EBY39_10210 [Flavobacteriia bacterium]|nr:hypothetical protein [Flavobacteriia bacterium]
MLDINDLINKKEFRKIFTKHLTSALNVPEEVADLYIQKKIFEEIDMLGKVMSQQDSTVQNKTRDLSQLNENEINNKTIKES